MYEMVFGDGLNGMFLLAYLGFTEKKDVGRYRSAWIEIGEDGKPRIAIYTRNGGGNRECCEDGKIENCKCTGCIITKILPKHENYLSDVDDDFDCTYATVYFSIPDKLKDVLSKHDKDWEKKIQQKVDMSEMWKKAIDSLK
jgi:hypothetical protein